MTTTMNNMLLVVSVAMATFTLVTTKAPPPTAIPICAAAILDAHDLEEYDKNRKDTGIDVSIADITSVQPPLLNGKDGVSPLANTLKDLTLLCTELKRRNDTTPLEDVLASGGSCDEFECPFTAPTDCATAPKYRKADGTCNNVANPLWGSSGIPFIRKLEPVYGDGQGSPRSGPPENPLPGARVVSQKFHSSSAPTPIATSVSTLYTGFGQFLSHDMAHTPMEKGCEGIPLNCCPTEHQTKCFNIAIPGDDSFFQPPRTCMPFKRSVPSTDLNCASCTRQQLNMVTSFVDASSVYGDSTARSNDMRVLNDNTKKGQLKVSGIDLFPLDSHQNPIAQENGFHLFKAGDPKLNEHHGLFSATLLFHRAHNKIAAGLSAINSGWDDEIVYQETRRIIIAILQHIVYDEYLEVTLPDATMISHGLRSESGQNHYLGYMGAKDPTTMNVFATAAMRFGHSMVNNVNRYADSNLVLDPVPIALDQTFFRPLTYICKEMDINRGQLVTKSEDLDRHFVSGMRDTLFHTSPNNGLDITALNIQRGRDHGLAPYHMWRVAYGFLTGTTAGVYPDHSTDDADDLNSVYSLGGADLFSAMVSETPLTGHPVGPLVAAMLADQFQRTKQGDRYWYETNEAPQAFTGHQLKEIRKVTMAKMLCEHFDLNQVQKQPFLIESAGNPMVPCNTLSYINLAPWTETR